MSLSGLLKTVKGGIMKIKYVGVEPITDRFGDWKTDEVKEVPDISLIKNWKFFEFDVPQNRQPGKALKME